MKTKRGQKAWDDKEVFLLLKCAGIISKETIAKILGVPVTRVSDKAKHHGIKLAVKE